MSGERLPGHYRLGEAPVGLWEVPGRMAGLVGREGPGEPVGQHAAFVWAEGSGRGQGPGESPGPGDEHAVEEEGPGEAGRARHR